MSRRLEICYRFQHTSNGELYGKNPGINIHLLGLVYRPGVGRSDTAR